MATGLTPQGLGRYVPRALAEWDLDAPDTTWRQVDGSLCMVDISGFTALAERLARRGREGAEELTRILNGVFGDALALAFQRGGGLLKFGGDALLLMFTGPDHAMQACSAAVEVRSVVGAASGTPTSAGRLSLGVSMGLHSGAIDLIRAGELHHELLVVGPAASITAEMERLADRGTIVVSEATRLLLPLDAVGEVDSNAAVLRWRRPRIHATGQVRRRAVPAEETRLCVPALVRAHLEHGRAEPEHRTGTIAFLRLSGIDKLLTRSGPAATAEALTSVVTFVQKAADEESVAFLGTDIDVDGCKIVLAAGVPTAVADDAGRMLRTLRRVADGFDDDSLGGSVDGTGGMSIQLGAHRGHIYAGEVGNSYRSTYTVMGDTVNLAARLMGAAPAGSIYVTPTVLDETRTSFATTPIEPLRVKGKAQPQAAVSLGAMEGVTKTSPVHTSPFVGRTHELQQLTSLLLAAAAGSGQVVDVFGDAGQGKSRLAAEAVAAVPSSLVMVARGEPSGLAAYGAVQEVVRQAVGIVPGPPEQQAKALRRRVRELVPDLLPLLPLIGSAAHVSVPMTPEVEALELRFRPDRLADCVLRLLEAGQPGPLVIVAEDAQWLDDGSAHLIAAIATAAGAHPWALITIRRPEEGAAQPDGVRIEVGPLPDEEMWDLLLAATADAPRRTHDLEAVAARGGGNPLFALELLAVAGASDDGAAVPGSIEAVAAFQLDRLPPHARARLREASVLGTRFPITAFEELLDGSDIEVGDIVDDLEGFLQRDREEGWLRFRLAVHRDAAYQGMSYARRRELHRRAAEAIERNTAPDPDRAAHRLARHWAAANVYDRAWRYGRVAAERAEAAYSNPEAVELYRLALEAVRHLGDVDAREQARVWGQLGDVLGSSGRFEDGLAAYRRAALLMEKDPVATAALWLRRARSHERAGAYRSALRDLASGRRALVGIETRKARRVRAGLMAFSALVREAQERPGLAVRSAEEAIEGARAAGDRQALARASLVLSWALRVLGKPGSITPLEEARRIFAKDADLAGQAIATANLGAFHFFDGRWDDAVSAYGAAIEVFHRIGDEVQAAVTAANLGEVLVNQRRWTEAEPVLRDASRVLQASGFDDGVTFAEMHLARIFAGLGDVGRAEELLTRVRSKLLALGKATSALEVTIYLAECRLAAGDAAGALATLDGYARPSKDAALLAVPFARVRWRALLALGRSVEAENERSSALSEARNGGMPYELALLLDDGRGDPEAADLLRSLGVSERRREPRAPGAAWSPKERQRRNLGSPAPK